MQGGKYTIEKELGRGRFGITYLVKNNNSDRQVIKTLNDDLLLPVRPFFQKLDKSEQKRKDRNYVPVLRVR